MFTGIVEELGTVSRLDVHDGHARLEIDCTTVVEDAALGDSISVNGCCLTVTDHLDGRGFAADLMAATLEHTSLGQLAVGSPVNLERAMAAGGRFGGHLVQGHVDAVGEVVGRDEQPGTTFLSVAVPAHLAAYLVAKGSITLDGTSLTIVDVAPGETGPVVRIGLIPHTLEVTTWGSRKVGEHVNVEVDVVAKYVERMLAGGVDTPYRTTDQNDEA